MHVMSTYVAQWLRKVCGVSVLAEGQLRMSERLVALEAECARLAVLAAQHDATAAKAVMAADLAQRAERRAQRLAASVGAERGVRDGRRVGLDIDLETLDT